MAWTRDEMAARAAKERAMLERQQERLLDKLGALDASLRAEPRRDLAAVGRRLGRWLGRYPAADKLFSVEILTDASGAAGGLLIACRLDRGRWAHQAHGAYLLRTNCLEKDPAQLWRWYIQLTQAEAAFRTEKSDLHLRPIYHQKTDRVEAHLLVCFLALAMWRTLEMWMKGKGLGTCARQLLAEIATVKSLDIVLPVRTSDGVTQLRLRTVARPERRVAELLHHLGVELPAGARGIENVVAKNAL